MNKKGDQLTITMKVIKIKHVQILKEVAEVVHVEKHKMALFNLV